MAANKFATLLHRKTNKMTLVLVYAFLEWVLIFFLLLNSIFSYFIIKFADYFGLQKPCLWCCRLDHVFEPSKFHNSHRSLICEAHSVEISKLGYCSNHRKLAEARDMCVDCKSSAPGGNPKQFVFFPMMNKLGVNALLISKCSCCGVSLEKSPFSPNGFLTKHFWPNSVKGNLILEDEIKDEEVYFDGKGSDFVYDHIGEKQGINDEEKNREGKTEEKFAYSVSSLDCNEMAADLVVEIEGESVKKDDGNLCEDEEVRVETREMSSEIESQHLEFYIDQDACHLIPIETEESTQKLGKNEMEDEDFVMEFDKHEVALKDRSNLEEKLPLLPILECEEEDLIAELEAIEFNEIDHFEDFPIESLQSVQGESESRIYQGSKQDEEEQVEFRSLTVETSEMNENREEEKIPDTPNSVEIEHLLFTEESLDGSDIEKLKWALKAEREALNAVYEELEEERNCSAEAANQTMAMINRLQQEKAAIQMEALQYQRIMEQQSEYDQEALQLMNQLMVKREKELEFYRKKVQDYETREKLKKSEESEVSKHNTPFDSVLSLQEGRLSILGQLKAREDKLFSLGEDQEQEHLSHENGNGHVDRFEVNGKRGKKLNGASPKRLLPLFDAFEDETEEEVAINKYEVETIEQVYEGLQALEEDREFVKHCVTSLNKGDKGVLLLHEILQLLRDLRYVQTRARPLENGFRHS